MIQHTYFRGVSTTSSDNPVQALSGTGILKSQVKGEKIVDRLDIFSQAPTRWSMGVRHRVRIVRAATAPLWIAANHLKVRQMGRTVSAAVTVSMDVNADGLGDKLGMVIRASEARAALSGRSTRSPAVFRALRW